MTNDEIKTEDLIFQAAYNIFLLYGYHGTTLHQIAVLAGVHKSAIHYYFRSKEKLYRKVVMFVLDNILKPDINFKKPKISEKQRWFLSTELYNNQNLFEKTLKEFYLNDWDKKLNELKELLET
jgi:AcrR family transcriptional regulator